MEKLERQQAALEKRCNEQQTTEDMMEFMECDDPTKYRKKIKGFHMAFNIREKMRIPDEEKSKYKFKSKQPIDEIKKNVEEIKIKRTSERVQREREEQEKQERDREALRKMHEQMRKEKQKTMGGAGLAGGISNQDSYKDLRSKKQG